MGRGAGRGKTSSVLYILGQACVETGLSLVQDCVLPCSWVIATSVLFFPLLPSSGLRSRQKCMSQRYMVPAGKQALEVGDGGQGLVCSIGGLVFLGISACLGSHWQGPGHLSLWPFPLLSLSAAWICLSWPKLPRRSCKR